jgi:hypothetical protein
MDSLTVIKVTPEDLIEIVQLPLPTDARVQITRGGIKMFVDYHDGGKKIRFLLHHINNGKSSDTWEEGKAIRVLQLLTNRTEAEIMQDVRGQQGQKTIKITAATKSQPNHCLHGES